MPASLAIAADRDLFGIGRPVVLDAGKRRLDQLDRLGVRDVIAGIAFVERRLVGMAKEEVGRQHRISILGATHGLVSGMFYEAITLVHENDRRIGTATRWIGKKSRHSVGACDVLRGDDRETGGHLIVLLF